MLNVLAQDASYHHGIILISDGQNPLTAPTQIEVFAFLAVKAFLSQSPRYRCMFAMCVYVGNLASAPSTF